MPAPTLKPASAPPRPIVKLVMAFRNFLLRLTDAMVPPQVALLDRLGSYYLLHSLHAATKFGLADALADGPKTASQLAESAGAREEFLVRLLRALVSFGIFEQAADGRYRQNRLSNVLRKGTQGSLRDLALFVAKPYHLHAWDKFVDNLRTGKNAFQAAHGEGLFEYLNHNPEDGAHFAGAMVSLTEMDAANVAASYGFGRLGAGAKICDVAGGRGTLLATILVRHAQLRGVLFDEAVIVDSAPPLLAAYGVADRVERISGSFFTSVPEGCALYILKDILHDWDDARALSILKTLRKAMRPGAILLVAEMIVEGPEERFFGTLLDLEMMVVTYDGRQRSVPQFTALFKQAGLRFSRVIPMASPTSLVEAIAE